MSAILTKTTLIDNLVTATWYNIRSEIMDCVYKVTPLYNYLNEKKSIKGKAPEGTHWEVPMRYAKADQNTGYFGRGDLAGMAEKEVMTRLKFYTKNAWTGIPRFWDDDRKNRGPAKLLDYATEIVDNARDSIMDMFETDLHVQSSDTQSINALITLFPEDPTADVSIGGVSRSGNEHLQNQYKDCNGLTTGTSLIDEMERMYNLCSEYKGGKQRSPDFISTSRKLYQDYKRAARAMGVIEMNSNQQRVDLGFGDILYNGAEMFWSPSSADDHMFMLNSEHIEFLYDPTAWFEMTEWKAVAGNSLDRTAQIVCVCNLTCNNFRKNGIMFNWTPTTS